MKCSMGYLIKGALMQGHRTAMQLHNVYRSIVIQIVIDSSKLDVYWSLKG